MTVTCVYNKLDGMRVVSLDERAQLLSTGEWFDQPNCKYNDEDYKNERQIRRRTRKGTNERENTSDETGCAAQLE